MRQVITRLQTPYVINDQEIYLGASIGITLAPQDSMQAEELLRFADIAMCEAKIVLVTGGVFTPVK